MLRIMEVNYPTNNTSKIGIPYESEAADKKNHTEKTRIYLPIPQNLQDSNSLTWGEDRIGPLGAALYNFAEGAITDPGEMLKKFQELISNPEIIRNQLNISNEEQKALTSYMAAQAASQFSNVSPNSVITRSTGQVFQSNLELLFQGVNLRQFAFPFTFAPRNKEEADEIKGIIRVLKKHSSAKKTTTTSTDQGKIFMKSPDVFKLQFMQGNQVHPFLNQFKTCALTNLNFNYTGTGNYATYKRGEPVMINMTLAFKEIVPIYYEDYDTKEGSIGFGY